MMAHVRIVTAGVGILLRFFDRGHEFCTEKLSRGGDFDGKN